MSRLSLTSRSQAVLLVVIGLLFVPTIAVGARLVSSWQSGSAIVRKIGPLAPIAWTPSEADYDDSGGDWGRYILVEPLTVASPSLPGTITSQLAIRFQVEVSDVLADAFDQALSDHPGSSCYAGVYWAVGADPGYGFFDAEILTTLLELHADSEGDLGSLAGTYVRTSVVNDYANMAERVSDGEVISSVGCALYDEEQGEYIDIPLSFSGQTLVVTPVSLRILAY